VRAGCRPSSFNEFAVVAGGAPEDGLPADVAVHRAAPQEDSAGGLWPTPPADSAGARGRGGGAEEAEGAPVATVVNPVRRAALTAAPAEDDFEEEV
jgi:hypothetical protein